MQQSGTIVNGKSSMNKMPPQSSCFPDWSSGCQNSSGMEPNLSVVTTVWGMTASSQGGPHSTYATTGNVPNNSHNGPSNTSGGVVPPNYMKNQQQYWNNSNQSMGPSYPQQQQQQQQRNESTGPTSSRQDSNYPNQSPLGVTAMVTAIATATATATASVVALQERQEGNNPYQMNSMPNQYSPYNNNGGNSNTATNASNQTQQRMSNSGVMSSGGINNQKMSMQQGESVYGRSNVCRSSPYPTTPPSHINQKRGQTSHGIGPNPSGQVYPGSGLPNVPPSQFEGMNPYGHPSYHSSGQTNINPRMMYRGNMRPGAAMPGTRNSHVPPYSYPNGQQYYNPSGMHPGNLPQRMGQGVQMSPHHMGLPPGYPHNSYLQHQQSSMSQYSNGPMPSSTYPDSGGTYSSSYGGEPRPMRSYPHSPIPGNPTPLTPPLTPASSAPPCYNIGHSSGEAKPVISTTNESELRLTFPVRDGTILAPFRLEHNLAVSNHVFHLKPTVHQTLTYRSDLELQLKCFHHEDRQMNTNWPASVQVSVNAIPLSIDRGENKISHKPLYLKDICLPGRNTLQITVSACCCSHLFVLQLVHRPSVRSVLQGLLRKRLLPAEHCITKIKRHFNNNSYYGNNQNQGSQDGDGVEQTAIKVSLKCPITYKRMSLPARGHDCKHVQCFDLESYLHLNCERASWRCPVCNKTAQLEGLEVDQYIWSILNALTSSDSEEVTIDSAANWRETTSATGFKTKSETVEPCSAKKAKLISPSEMHMTTWNSDMVMSPYGSPSMHNMSMGQPMNPYGSMSSTWSGSPAQSNSFEFGNDYGGPLSRLKESVNSLEALNAMEKSISEQASAGSQGKGFNETSKSDLPYILHTPQTPHTPGTGEHGSLVASSPSHVPNLISSSNHSECEPPNLATLIASDLPSDLNFDPESVINGEGSGQEELNLLPHSGVDPLELLSYLEPSGLATPPSSGDRENGGGSNLNSTPDSISDDLLSLFD